VKLIGIEEHFLTDEVRQAWRDLGLEAGKPGVALHAAAIERRLFDLADERIALMDETGLDVQVLSLTSPGLHDLEVGGLEIARRINDAIAEVVARRPDRFQAFATLPIASPDEAAEELDRCVRTLGFKGTMLCGRVGSRNLDDPAFLPVFRTAAQLRAPVFLHPQAPSKAIRAAYYDGFKPEVSAALATYSIGWHYETGVQFLRLILAGVLDQMPGLQLILGHWGELVLFYTERFASLDRVAGLERSVETCLRENVHVTSSGMFLPHYLRRAAAVVGEDRLLFSTDYPYQYRPGRDARTFLENCGLDEGARAGFASDNWLRLIERCGQDG